MKKKLTDMVKYQVIKRPDEYWYSVEGWSTRIVEGVEFISVVRNPITHQTQPIQYIRKDSLKRVEVREF